jgi:hypothetical protein
MRWSDQLASIDVGERATPLNAAAHASPDMPPFPCARFATPCLRRSSPASPATKCPTPGPAFCWLWRTGKPPNRSRSQEKASE